MELRMGTWKKCINSDSACTEMGPSSAQNLIHLGKAQVCRRTSNDSDVKDREKRSEFS